MRFSAGFALILVGAASVATAEPEREEVSGRVSLRDQPLPAKRIVRQAGEWALLASDTPTRHGQEHIGVGKEAGTFSALRIDASKGTVVVLRVKVVFADGTAKNYVVDTRLSAKRKKSTIVDLKNERAIERVIVKTETYTRGAYALYGTSSLTAVAGR